MDITRSIGLFDPNKYKGDIHILGVGATGSHVVDQLLSHGVPGSRIHVYDPGMVKSHNRSNQLYIGKHVGMPKVVALQEHMQYLYEQNINVHNEKVEDCSEMTGAVFILIDGNRGPLFETIKYNSAIHIVIETGLDARIGRVLIMNPINPKHVDYFTKVHVNTESEVFEDSRETTACGSPISVKTTVAMVSSMAMVEFTKWVNDQEHAGYETVVAIEPYYVEETKM